MRWQRLLVLAATVLSVVSTAGAQIRIDESESIFAIVTHKGGLAAGKAHNHLVTASDRGPFAPLRGYDARLDFDPASPLTASFALELATAKLDVDRPDLQAVWYPRLSELAILDEPFSEVSEKDRGKIRKAMLSEGQLDGDGFPKIAARVTGIAEHPALRGGSGETQPSTVGDVTFPYVATLALEVKGRTVEKTVAARYEMDGDRLILEAVGVFRFTDFGIKPYSAALGLVKNLDEFHVYLYLEATFAEATGDP